MKTIDNREEKTIKLSYTRNPQVSDNTIDIEILGQQPERSYEDRDVFVLFGDEQIWLRGGDAIELGQALIEQGSYSLIANMLNHQLIHKEETLVEYIAGGYVKGLEIIILDRDPVNYGAGYMSVNIKPIWIIPPKYNEDFNFDKVVYNGKIEVFEKKYGVPVIVKENKNECIR